MPRSDENFTLCDLHAICSSGELDSWLKKLGLKHNFSGVKCFDCEDGVYVLTNDTAYLEGVCWKCNVRSCRKKISVKFGSWFENSKLSYEQVLKVGTETFQTITLNLSPILLI